MDYACVQVKKMIWISGKHPVKRWFAVPSMPILIRGFEGVATSVRRHHRINTVIKISLDELSKLHYRFLLHNGIPRTPFQNLISLK